MARTSTHRKLFSTLERLESRQLLAVAVAGDK